jgi:hypothetical protein
METLHRSCVQSLHRLWTYKISYSLFNGHFLVCHISGSLFNFRTLVRLPSTAQKFIVRCSVCLPPTDIWLSAVSVGYWFLFQYISPSPFFMWYKRRKNCVPIVLRTWEGAFVCNRLRLLHCYFALFLKILLLDASVFCAGAPIEPSSSVNPFVATRAPARERINQFSLNLVS